jgi:hypothetical protein
LRPFVKFADDYNLDQFSVRRLPKLPFSGHRVFGRCGPVCAGSSL